ncbi:MAG TPA: hypothetical protein VIY69_17845 [Candidatus Acidoferrales bacterium]
MTDKRNRKDPATALRASIAKELAAPRMTKSAKMATLRQDTARVPVQPSMSMPGTVEKVILSSRPGQREKIQIGVDGADTGYRDLRIENILIDEHGDDVTLQKGAAVELTVTAHPKI